MKLWVLWSCVAIALIKTENHETNCFVIFWSMFSCEVFLNVCYQERIRRRSVQLPYNHVYYRSLKSAAACAVATLNLGLSLRFVARSCLPLHPSTLHPTRLQRKQVSVKPEPRPLSYAACKNLPYKEGFCSAHRSLGSDNCISCTLLPLIRSWCYMYVISYFHYCTCHVISILWQNILYYK